MTAAPRNVVRFVAPRFGPTSEPDDAASGLGRGADALAAWLADGLRRANVAVDATAPEDWGRRLELTCDAQRLWIGCGPVDGSDATWLLWIEPRGRRLVDRIRGHGGEASERVAAAQGITIRAVDALLRADGGISEIEWHRVDADQQELDHGPTPGG